MKRIAATILVLALSTGGAGGAELTGAISDKICSGDHRGQDPVKCTLSCVEHGSLFVLVVGENRVLEIENQGDAKIAAELRKYAGLIVTVTGTMSKDGKALKVEKIRTQRAAARSLLHKGIEGRTAQPPENVQAALQILEGTRTNDGSDLPDSPDSLRQPTNPSCGNGPHHAFMAVARHREHSILTQESFQDLIECLRFLQEHGVPRFRYHLQPGA